MGGGEGRGRQVGQSAGGQVNDVQQVTEIAEATATDDGGLHLAVDGFGCCVGQLVLIARQNARQMVLQGLSQFLEWLQSAASGPADPGPVERFRRFTGTGESMDFLEALFHAPRPGGLQSGAL